MIHTMVGPEKANRTESTILNLVRAEVICNPLAPTSHHLALSLISPRTADISGVFAGYYYFAHAPAAAPCHAAAVSILHYAATY